MNLEAAKAKRLKAGWSHDPAPDLWRSEILGYTLSEGEQGHAKSPKDLYSRV